MIYSVIMLLSFIGIVYGFTHFSPTEFKVVHERQPLFIKMSDGDIQNKYTLKLLNKTKKTLEIKYSISGLENADVIGLDGVFHVKPGKIVPITALVKRKPNTDNMVMLQDFKFIATAINDSTITTEYIAVFMSN
jgi:polyferredoxin